MARISTCMWAFSLFVATCTAAQSGFPALLAERGAAEYHDELMLFGQFVGSWQFNSVEYRDDGKRTQKGELYFHWILNGTAIQDVWIETERNDSDVKELGTTIRYYDPKTKLWSITYIEPVRGETIMKGGKVGDDIVLTGQLASGTPMRWIFSEIKPNSFHWYGEVFMGKDWHRFQDLWAHRSQ